MDPHSISCVFTDVKEQNTVSWTTSVAVSGLNLAPVQGAYQSTSHSQTSTLAVSSEQLVKLKTAGGKNPAHVFTCKIVVGKSNTEVTAVQSINIYTPGK